MPNGACGTFRKLPAPSLAQARQRWDRSHTPAPASDTLNAAQKRRVALRKTLLVLLADCGGVAEFLNPNASRSGLDRCLRAHGVGTCAISRPRNRKPKAQRFRLMSLDYIHIDVKYLPQMAR